MVEKDIELKHLNSRWGMLITNSLIGVLPVRAVGGTFLKNIAEEAEVVKLVAKFSP